MDTKEKEQVTTEDTNLKNNSETANKTENKFSAKSLEGELEGGFKIKKKVKQDDVRQEKQEEGEVLQRGSESKESGNGEAEQSGGEKQTNDSQNVLEEIVDETENKSDAKEEAEGQAEKVLEEVVENEARTSKETTENKDTQEPSEVQSKENQSENKEVELPEGVDKLIEFMRETGGSLQDYARLNTDWTQVDDNALLRQYLKDTKPHLDDEEIGFLIEDKFSFDEDVDDEREIKRKKLAYKEAVGDARNHFQSMKDKYYNELKLGSKLTPEQKEAVEFYKQYQTKQSEQQELAQKRGEHFTNATNNLFNEEFKGFEFKVGEKKYRYNVNDVNSVKESQMDLLNVFSKYLDPKTEMLGDAQGYHKALFAASNPDALAQHFYEQGKADAIKGLEKSAKNVQMDARQTNDGTIRAKGTTFRVVSGESSSDFKIKKRQFKK